MLSPHKDRLWTLQQCKIYITGSHIARLWYCDDMDAIWDWLARWEIRMTACAIPKFALHYIEVIRWTKGGQDLPTCTYSNLTMVYVEVMLGKRVNWSTMTAHNHSHIITETIDIPSNVDWNWGIMHHAIANGLFRQGLAPLVEAPQCPHVHIGTEDKGWNHHFTSGDDQYGGRESWDLQGTDRGDRYRAWNDHNEGRAAQYMDKRGTWGNREESYREDHYPYTRGDVVDDTIHEEDFQNVNDDNYYVPWYLPFHSNVYNWTKRYPEPPSFRSSEWDDERGLRIRIIEDDVNIMRGGIGNSGRNIHDYHSW
jgi:hypothetical protein